MSLHLGLYVFDTNVEIYLNLFSHILIMFYECQGLQHNAQGRTCRQRKATLSVLDHFNILKTPSNSLIYFFYKTSLFNAFIFSLFLPNKCMVKMSGQPGWINWKASEFLSLNKSSLVEIYFNTYECTEERPFQSWWIKYLFCSCLWLNLNLNNSLTDF